MTDLEILKQLEIENNIQFKKVEKVNFKTTDLEYSTNLQNQITGLSLYKRSVKNFSFLKDLKNLTSLNLENNPIKNENFKLPKGNWETAKYIKSWFTLNAFKQKEISLPSKILLVGNSNIGKSALRKILLGEKNYCKENSTHILEMYQWQKEDATIWDFGGQDYYHSVHHLFFSLSSLYIVLYSSKENKIEFFNDKKQDYYNFTVAYWLENINYICPDIEKDDINKQEQYKKVMLVENKIDSIEKNTEIINISSKYKIRNRYRVSLCPKGKTPSKKDAFQEKKDFLISEIKAELKDLKEKNTFKIPENYLNVVEKIKEGTFGKEAKYHYTKSEFIEESNKIIKKGNKKIDDAGLYYMFSHLRDAGLLFYYDDMPNEVWLSPDKLIKIIHDKLDKNIIKKTQNKEKGIVKETALEDLKENNLLNLLLAQEVLFRDDDKIVFPQYLKIDEENLILYEIAKTNLVKPAFTLKFEDFLPSAFMSRVICRFGKQEKGQKELRFYNRYEIIFTDTVENETIRVWIKTDLANLKVDVFVSEIKTVKNKQKYLKYLFKALMVAYEGKTAHLNYKDFDVFSLFNNRKDIIKKEDENEENLKASYSKFENSIWFKREFIIKDLNVEVNNNEVKHEDLKQLEKEENKGQRFIKTKDDRIVFNNVFEPFINIKLSAPMKIFISYSHKDYNYLERIETHLASLRRDGLIEDWNDTKFKIGDLWDDKIKSKLKNSDIVILLISADFINSSYIHNNELPLIMKLVKEGSCVLFPVVVEDCDWTTQVFAKTQTYPYKTKNDKGTKEDKKELETVVPIEEWEYKSKAYTMIAKKIREHINEKS